MPRLPRLSVSAVVLLLPLWLQASEIKSFSPGSDRVPTKMMAPQEQRFADDEGYFETWMLMLYLKGGGWVQARFILTNVGPGDSHAAVDVMRFGVPLEGENVGSKIDAKGYQLEADIKARGPHWRPGDGEVKFPEGGRFGVHLMPSLLRVTGKEKMGQGEWQDIKGTGWGEHGFTNVAAHRLSKRFLRFHGRKGNVAVAYHELFTPENYGEERMGFIVVTKGSKVLAHSLVASSSPTKFKKDRPWPHHKTGPRIYREDVLNTVPGWVRRVVQMFIQPVNFYHRAKFEVTLPDGNTFQGRGMSLYSPMRAKL